MPDDRKKTLVLLLLIGIAAVVAYLPAMSAGFIWDDDQYIEENGTLKSWQGLWEIWAQHDTRVWLSDMKVEREIAIPQYYPLVHTTYWFEHLIWGLSPIGYHVVNLVIHLASCWLLFVLVRRLSLPGAVLVAGVFALHPVMVESVAWVTERKNTLSMLFYLLTLLTLLRRDGLDGRPAPDETQLKWFTKCALAIGCCVVLLAAKDLTEDVSGPKSAIVPTLCVLVIVLGWKRGRLWWLAFGLFLCALLSKSVTFSLPFTFLLILWWKRGRLKFDDVWMLVPFMLLGGAYGYYTSHLEWTHVGSHDIKWTETIVDKCLIAGRVPWFYLSKLVFPLDLTFIYARWDVDPSQFWQWLFPIATVGLIVGVLVMVRRIGRGPVAAVLMFGGTLFPAIGFFAVFPFRYSYVADHFQYHASLGILILACAVLTKWIKPAVGLPVAVIVLGLYGVKTFEQCGKYKDRETLFESILADDPNGWFAYNNLAAIYVNREGAFDRGFEYYKRVYEINPSLAANCNPEAYAHCMAAEILYKANAYKEVMLIHRESRELLDQSNRARAVGDHVRANELSVRSQATERQAMTMREQRLPMIHRVRQHFLASVQSAPRYVTALSDFGGMLMLSAYAEGRLTKTDPRPVLLQAREYWYRSLRVKPKNPAIRSRLHNMLLDIADMHRNDARQAKSAAERDKHLREAESLRREADYLRQHASTR